MIYSISDGTTLESIYKNLDEYKNLRDSDKEFFDKLFPMLLYYDNDVYSNSYLCNRFNMPKSTLEKRLRRLDNVNLIHKWDEKERINGTWTTIARHIVLDPATFSFMRAKSHEEKIQCARQEAFDKKEVKPMLENESNEAYLIRTGKVEVSNGRVSEETDEDYFLRTGNLEALIRK